MIGELRYVSIKMNDNISLFIKMIKIRGFFVSVLSLFFLFQVYGQDGAGNQIRRSYNLKPSVGNIIINGSLNEESWKLA